MFHTESSDEFWPTDMSITIVSGELTLLELLWVRHHSGLVGIPHLPPADLPQHPHDEAEIEALEARWRESWHEAIQRSVAVHLMSPAEIPHRPDLWGSSHPIALAESEGVTLEGAESWKRSLTSREGAERAAVPELRAAWRRGLRLVIELPLAGDHGRQYDEHVLITSAARRADARKYATLLSSFT